MCNGGSFQIEKLSNTLAPYQRNQQVLSEDLGKLRMIEGETHTYTTLLQERYYWATMFSELRPNKVIGILKPDIHVKGPGYKKDELPETPIIKSYGGRIEIVDTKIPVSTTKIIEKIVKRYKSG